MMVCMPRVNLYLPADLHRRMSDELPVEENASQIFQAALRARLERAGCTHTGPVLCSRCHEPVDQREPTPAA